MNKLRALISVAMLGSLAGCATAPYPTCTNCDYPYYYSSLYPGSIYTASPMPVSIYGDSPNSGNWGYVNVYRGSFL